MNGKTTKAMGISAGIVAILVIFDQITKQLAVSHLMNKEPYVILDGVFELHYLENQSAAFGIDLLSILQGLFHFSYFENHPQVYLQCKMIFFAVVTVAVLSGLIWVYRRIPSDRRYRYLNIIVILFVAGAIGNLIDRIVNHYVVDFFYFKWINFPIFNVADIYVTIAAFAFIIFGLFYYKEEDYERIFPSQ